jgi:hypothetical protein
VPHMRYTVFTYSAGGTTTPGGSLHDFEESPLRTDQTVSYGDSEWIVDHVDENASPPAVWLRPVSEGDLPL